jgi:AcrR family transcriptional regulator
MKSTMTEGRPKSKGSRRYDASARWARAQEQYERTLENAKTMFLERGYVASTVEAIARSAGVSAATVYKTYGGKAGLLRELCGRALAGEGVVPAEERSDALRTGNDATAIVEGWGALTAEVSPRISPLLLLLRTAADGDDDAAALHAEFEAARLARMTENARFLARDGHLRPGVSVEEARDVLWFCTAPETYDLLVARRGWSTAQLGRFVTATITGSLL